MTFFYKKKRKEKKALLSSLDPRSRLFATLTLIVVVLITPGEKGKNFIILSLFIFFLAFFSRFSIREIGRGIFLIFPLLLFLSFTIFLTEGNHLVLLFNLWIKFLLIFFTLRIFSLTTDLTELIKALEKMRVPHLLTSLLFLSLRFIFVFGEETERKRRALISRTPWRMRMKIKLKVLSSLIIHFLDQIFLRSQTFFAAMLSRGFEGRVRTISDLRLKKGDYLFLSFFLGLIFYSIFS